MPDYSNMKLGKIRSPFEPHVLRLAKIVPSSYVPPAEVDYTAGVTDFGAMVNDKLGDCTIAACGHAIQTITANNIIPVVQGMKTPTDETIVNYYQKWDGYDPAVPYNDPGGMPSDVLQQWKAQGLDGHKLIGFAQPQPQNIFHVKHSIDRFGGIYVGVQLPMSAQTQEVWDVVPDDGGVWGGHAVWCPAYDHETITCITWGALKQMTWVFFDKYCDESYTLLLEEWEGALSRGADGLDVEALKSEMAALP